MRLAPLIAALVLGCAAPEAPSLNATTAPIVGGEVERGYPAAVALVSVDLNVFCSGTLIRPSWVLTAAHCVDDLGPGEVAVAFGETADPADAHFFNNLLPAAQVIVHPSYRPGYLLLDDIALLELTEPALIEPIPENTVSLNALSQLPVRAIGYGTSGLEGLPGQPVNQKRSTVLKLQAIFPAFYVAFDEDSGVCYGDSGGPDVMVIEGVPTVVGVHSTGQADDCFGPSNTTRVDAYQTWIREAVGEPTRCESCTCGECPASGVCELRDCGQGDCAALRACMVLCVRDGTCQAGCYSDASDLGREHFDNWLGCADAYCPGLDADCLATYCPEETARCEPTNTCAQQLSCAQGCADDACVSDCAGAGSAFWSFYHCARDACGSRTPERLIACGAERCPTEYLACVPNEACEVGTCEGGAACLWGGCVASLGREVGERCEPAVLPGPVDCADGLVCVGPTGSGTCRRSCALGCADGERCLESETLGAGVCVCADLDEDGICAPWDCDDLDPAIHPDAAERCETEQDDNCDGQVNEGCGPVCPDQDGDGFCGEADCDDTSAGVFPGAPERCGDQRDDDCDGEIDEGCERVCVDQDEDGACAEDDCDDTDPSRRPGAVELCNGLDDNCDGEIDEGCTADCPDLDGDGACAPWDCDDQNAAVRPGLPESCDSLDQNCNGLVDEDCVVRETLRDRGLSGCTTTPGAPTAPALWLGLFALALRRRRS